MTRHANQATESLPVVPAKVPTTGAVLSSDAEQKLAQVAMLFDTFTAHYRAFQRDVQRFYEEYQRIAGNDIRKAAEGFTPDKYDSWLITDLLLAESTKLVNSVRDGMEHIAGMDAFVRLAIRANAAKEVAHD